MKIYICSNQFTDIQQKQAKDCHDLLCGMGHDCSLADEKFFPQDSDLILSLGGDGALLKAAKTALEADKPLLGINSGRRGYLCAMSYEQIGDFNEVFDRCVIHERSLLSLRDRGNVYYALNDFVVSKDDFGKTVDLNVRIEGQDEFEIRGDGVIICTPTGSTAYNLSAGGPRLDMDAEVFAVTPICAHDKNTYCRICDDDRKIVVSVNHESALVFCDGGFVREIDDSLTFGKADRTLKLYLRA